METVLQAPFSPEFGHHLSIATQNNRSSLSVIGQVFPAPDTQCGQAHGRSNSHNIIIILPSVAHGDPVLFNRSIS